MHVNPGSKGGKDKEREAWGSGGPMIADVATATQPYNCTVQELEVRVYL